MAYNPGFQGIPGDQYGNPYANGGQYRNRFGGLGRFGGGLFGPRGPIIGNPFIWGSVVLGSIGSIIIYSLMLSHCVSVAIGDMWLFKVSNGSTTVEVGYLGMCLDSKSLLTFNQDASSIAKQFGVDPNSVPGQLIQTGRDLQGQFPIAFSLPFAAQFLFLCWMLMMALSLRKGDPMRMQQRRSMYNGINQGMPPNGNPGMPPNMAGALNLPQMFARKQRLSWTTWKFMVGCVGVPSIVVAVGSAWSLTTGTRAVEGAAHDVSGSGSPSVQRGQILEAIHWIAAALAIILIAHTSWLLVETRRKLGLSGQLDMFSYKQPMDMDYNSEFNDGEYPPDQMSPT